MTKTKAVSIIYLLFALTFTGISSYLDYNNLESGSKFHQLSKSQRNLIRINGLGTVLTNPVTLLTTPIFIGKKPRPRKVNYAMTITLLLNLVPSSWLWLRYITKGKLLA